MRTRTLLPRGGWGERGREHARDTAWWVFMSHCECVILEASGALQVPGATLGGGVAVAFPAGCVQPTCESLGWGLLEGEGRCGTPPGDTRPPPWAPQVTSPLSSTPSPLVRLLRPEGCLCRFFLQRGQGRGLTFGWQRLSRLSSALPLASLRENGLPGVDPTLPLGVPGKFIGVILGSLT